MTDTVPAKQPTDRLIYLATIGLSFALSAWGGYSQFIPNPDGALYLRAAELFSAGQWREGFAVYRWPTYSLTIALVMFVTGAGAQLAVQVANALFDCATVVIFVALVRRLAIGQGDRSLIGWAAFIIVLHPRLVQLRPMVIRDHGFYSFFLLALYLVVRDHQIASRWIKPAICGSIVAAALFRPEALLLGVIVPLFYLYNAASPQKRWLPMLLAIAMVCALLVPAYSVWTSAALLPSTPGSGMRENLAERLQDLFAIMSDRVARLRDLLPPGRNTGIVAYVGITLAVAAETVIRSITIPIAVLAILAFTPRRLMPDFAARFVLWFAGWQVPLLLAFMALTFFLDQRFAIMLALLLTIPAAFTLGAIAVEWGQRVPRARYLFPAAVLAVVIPWAINVPRLTKLEYLRDAGRWIGANTPAGARILTNDARIAYFSGRSYNQDVVPRATAETTDQDIRWADYLAIEIDRGRVPTFITNDLQSRQVATINGGEDQKVLIFRMK
jgi:hypothetical protein